jgi:hypothetical protein
MSSERSRVPPSLVTCVGDFDAGSHHRDHAPWISVPTAPIGKSLVASNLAA